MSNTPKTLTEGQEDDIRTLLVGRRIIAAVGGEGYTSATSTLVLDDGTIIEVLPNEGCGGCASGWYEVTKLATVDNAISHVECIQDVAGEYETEVTYRIHVIADATDMDVLVVSGDDGNGYYGSGYSLRIVPPAADRV